MHPNRKFQIADREEMAALVRAEGFGTLIVPTDEGLRAVHVPVLLAGERLLFHVSKSNLVHAALMAGAEALFVANGPHAYISPDWYGVPDRVPTWSYVAVELNGRASVLAPEELVRLLDVTSAELEDRLAPKAPWVRDTLSPGFFEGLLKSITGFALEIHAWRGTRKIDQDKPPEVRARLAGALAERGEEAMAGLISSPAFAGEGDRAEHGGGARAPRASSSADDEHCGFAAAPPPHCVRSPSPGHPGEDL
jgi:transcriptional regulator